MDTWGHTGYESTWAALRHSEHSPSPRAQMSDSGVLHKMICGFYSTHVLV